MADADRQPLNVRCLGCGHVWPAAYVPMPLRTFAELLGKTCCPVCAAGPKRIALHTPPEAPNG